MNILQPISISLSPNTERDDVLLALREIASFGFLRSQGREIDELEEAFSEKVGVRHTVSFNSGRSALMAILDAFKLKEGDEVLLQAFTCNAVPNPVLWSGLNPVYVDCEEDYNISPQDLEVKITKRSKAVIVQHTFGKAANMDAIRDICKQNGLFLIEDCAHALGAEYKGVGVGTFGDAAFFSFSRDKVISSVYGGMAVTNNAEYGRAMREFQIKTGFPSPYWSFQQLLHPIVMNWIVLPTYRIFGKYLLLALQVLHILSKAVHFKEKQGTKPGYFPKAMPNTLATLAVAQLGKLDRFNSHRKKIAGYYKKALHDTPFQILEEESGHIFLRLPVRHPQAHSIIRKAWDRNLLLGDWYTSAVAPLDTRLAAVQYEKGSAKKAEELAQTTLNLPTHIHITEREAEIVVRFLKQYANTGNKK